MQIDVPGVLSRIELRLNELNITKKEFYAQSGVSSANVSQWNTKACQPTLRKIGQAASFLGVTVEYLLYGNASPESPSEPEQKESPGPEAEGVSEADNITAELMSLWRAASPEQKQLYLKILKAMEDEHAEK